MAVVVVVAAALLVVAGAGAAGAPVKRLAWNKVAVQWGHQARTKSHAISCTKWAADAVVFECVVYNPAAQTGSQTVIAGVPRLAYGKLVMGRYDAKTLDVEPHAGCTYGFSVYGSDLRHVRSFVIDICERGWLAKVPAAP